MHLTQRKSRLKTGITVTGLAFLCLISHSVPISTLSEAYGSEVVLAVRRVMDSSSRLGNVNIFDVGIRTELQFPLLDEFPFLFWYSINRNILQSSVGEHHGLVWSVQRRIKSRVICTGHTREGSIYHALNEGWAFPGVLERPNVAEFICVIFRNVFQVPIPPTSISRRDFTNRNGPYPRSGRVLKVLIGNMEQVGLDARYGGIKQEHYRRYYRPKQLSLAEGCTLLLIGIVLLAKVLNEVYLDPWFNVNMAVVGFFLSAIVFWIGAGIIISATL